MAKRNARNTRGRIVGAAWQLFYEQGYEHTTVEEIIELSHTSKGSFYHYFDGKDALLSTLSDLFDEKYETLRAAMDPSMPALEQLLFLNAELFSMIENSVSMELLGPVCCPLSWSPAGKSICWTISAPITACCGASSPTARPGESSPHAAASTKW